MTDLGRVIVTHVTSVRMLSREYSMAWMTATASAISGLPFASGAAGPEGMAATWLLIKTITRGKDCEC
jgi:hypothetical protein